MRRLFRIVRPLEWALVAFVLFAVVRVGPPVLLEWRELAGLRTVSVFFTLAMVGAVYLARDFVRRPWPVGTAPLRRLLAVMLPLAGLPVAVGAVVAATSPQVAIELASIRAAQAIPYLATLFLRVVGFGLPTVVLWLSLAIHVKAYGRVDLQRYVAEGLQQLAVALREWTPLLLILSAYAWMDAVVGGKLGEERDAWMAAADRALFAGVDPLDLLERFISPWLSEWLAFSYSFYAVLYMLVFGAALFFGGRVAIRETCFLVGGALLIGYVSYSLIPVKGPLLTRTFTVPLDLYYIGPVKEAMMDATRVSWDCFPSMHTCCTVLLSWSAWRYARRLFWAALPMTASIPLACVYLRYHYVVDVIAGLALAAVLIVVSVRLRPLLVADLPAAPTPAAR